MAHRAARGAGGPAGPAACGDGAALPGPERAGDRDGAPLLDRYGQDPCPARLLAASARPPRSHPARPDLCPRRPHPLTEPDDDIRVRHGSDDGLRALASARAAHDITPPAGRRPPRGPGPAGRRAVVLAALAVLGAGTADHPAAQRWVRRTSSAPGPSAPSPRAAHRDCVGHDAGRGPRRRSGRAAGSAGDAGGGSAVADAGRQALDGRTGTRTSAASWTGTPTRRHRA